MSMDAKVPNGVKHCRKFQPAEWVHERYRQSETDRQTDDGDGRATA